MLTKYQQNMANAMKLAGINKNFIKASVSKFCSNVDVTANSLECPKCHSTMVVATLSDGRKCKYCLNDRVAVPEPMC